MCIRDRILKKEDANRILLIRRLVFPLVLLFFFLFFLFFFLFLFRLRIYFYFNFQYLSAVGLQNSNVQILKCEVVARIRDFF